MKNLMMLFVFLVVLGLFFSACEYKETPTGGVTTEPEVVIEIPANETAEQPPAEKPKEEAEPEKLPEDVAIQITGVEGDLIDLNPVAVDPDGDTLSYTFSKPFNENGLWQTNEGDEGKYLISITASDGKLSASENVLVVVKASNKAPAIKCPDTITVEEGDTVDLGCTITDKEGDDVVVDYSGWMTSSKKETGFADAGEHLVVVKASDGEKESTKEIKVIVKNANRAPVLKPMENIIATEGDTLTLNPDVTDPDNDRITIDYSKPFDSRGVWKTKKGDAGEYDAWVSVSDGDINKKENFKVVINKLNTAPMLKKIPDITVFEGETVKIPVDAYDPEADKITVKFEGWMSSETYVTSYDDANPKGCKEAGCTAQYKVKVIVSDGKLETTQTVNVFVKDKNRPPVFRVPA